MNLKNICAFTVLSMFVFSIGYAHAQIQIPEKRDIGPDPTKTLEQLSNETPKEKFSSKKTDDLTVAMLFHKITQQTPDFKEWSDRLTKDVFVLEQKFELTGIDEPIHIETFVTLRQHKKDSGGFFIQQFHEDVFFTFNVGQEYYAAIPTDLTDHQWIKLPEKKIEEFRKHMTDKGQLFMRLSLTPVRGDKTQTVPLANGKDNWLLAARVSDIEFWSPKDKILLWRKNQESAYVKNKLLKLYRKD